MTKTRARRSMSYYVREAKRREKMVKKILARQLTKTEAAKRMKLTTKTVYRLCKNYEAGGVEALVSNKRPGIRSNRRFSDEFRAKIKRYVFARKDEHPFSPKKMHDGLVNEAGFKISRETVRTLLIEWRLWKSRPRSKKKRKSKRG